MTRIFQSHTPRWIALAMAGLMAVIQACSTEAEPVQGVQFVDLETATAAVEAGMTVVDVRTDGEWAAGHLRAAQHLPLSTLDEALPATTLDRSKPVLLYCETGGRATRASRQFVEAGFTDIRVLKPGGYGELAAAGLPTTADRE